VQSRASWRFGPSERRATWTSAAGNTDSARLQSIDCLVDQPDRLGRLRDNTRSRAYPSPSFSTRNIERISLISGIGTGLTQIAMLRRSAPYWTHEIQISRAINTNDPDIFETVKKLLL